MNNEKLVKVDLDEVKDNLEISIENAQFNLHMLESQLEKVDELLGK